MKILLLSRNQLYKRNWGRELFKIDLSKFHDVRYYGRSYPNSPSKNIPQILKEVSKPDIIFTHVMFYASYFNGYELTSIPKVHLEVDYVLPKDTYPGTVYAQNPFYKKSKYNLVFGVTKRMVMDMKNQKIAPKIFWLPFSVSTDKYKNLNLEKTIDVMSVFLVKDYLYPNRRYLQEFVHSLKKLKVNIFTNYVIHDEYIKKINQSKIFITSNNLYNSLNMKYTEVLSCGTLLFANRPEDLGDIGLKDGEHLIIYNGWKDLKSKIRYYLSHDREREEIANNGMKLVREKHSNDIRIKEMTEIIQKEIME